MTAPRATPFVTVGALCGLAWAAGLRAYMVELAGQSSTFGWAGTFGAVLLPGAVTGALLGWAEHLRRTGGRPGWRWLALAPLTFAVAPLLLPGALVGLLTQGLGGGAVAVALLAIGIGYAVSGRGPRWPRILTGLTSLALLAAMTLAIPAVGGPDLSLAEPRGGWVAALLVSFMILLGLAASVPHRPIVTAEGTPGGSRGRARRSSGGTPA